MIGTRDPRYYVTPEGKKVPSVTTVMSLLAKPAITKWNMSGLMDVVRREVEALGAVTRGAVLDVLCRAPAVWERESRRAMDDGTAVHDMISRWITGDGVEIDAESARGNAFLAFREWFDANVDGVLLSEAVVYGCGYAGRVDLVVKTKAGARRLVDIKTSRAIWPEYGLQLAAYAAALALGDEPVDEYGVLRVGKSWVREAEYRAFHGEHEAYYRAFMGLLDVWELFRGNDNG